MGVSKIENDCFLSKESNPLSLSDSLGTRLQQRRNLWIQWVETEKQQCDETFETHASALNHVQSQIDDTAQEILAFQLEKDLNLSSGGSMGNEGGDGDGGSADSAGEEVNHAESGDHHAPLEQELAMLKESLDQKKTELEDLKNESEYEKQRAQDSRELLEQVEESAKSTIFHLNKANDIYGWAGLEIEKAPNGCVRFKFTQIDPNDPDRPFSILLCVNEDELYEIKECQPDALSKDALEEMERDLNDEEVDPVNDSLKTFSQSLRRAFIASLMERTPPRR